jgi:ubiquinone/menaquinone biosynthesis C-methylase UbiE
MRANQNLEGVSLTAADGMRMPFRDGSFHGLLALSALEHFEDLDGIVKEMARVIRPGGFVLYLAPSENRFYRLGRRLFGYEKPEDHYHSGAEVEATLRKHFESEINRSLPWFLPSFLGVYRLGRMRRRPGAIRVVEREETGHERSGEQRLLSFT